jgi:cell division protein FtsW
MLRAAKPHSSSTTSAATVTRRHRPDYHIVLYMGLLMLLGLIIMYAIGPQRANVLNNAYGTDYYTSTYFFIKQSLSLIVALGVFTFMAVVPYTYVQRYAKKILLIGFGACVVLAIAGFIGLGIAQCSLGACRWFNLGPLGSFQPAEVLKFGIVTFMAGFLSLRMRQGRINDIDKTIIPMSIVVGIALLFIIVIQKDMGTGISLAAILGSMLIVSGMSARVGGLLVVAALVIGLVLVMMAPHRRERIFTFLKGDTSSASTGDGSDYHIKHAKIAIGSGGLFGVGIGNSVQATGYLPEAINDSVFAIMGETFGFVGLTVIIGLFTALLMRLVRATDHLQDPWMRLVVAGVFGWLGAHVILNVASMIGLVPLTGITLPLLSFGGTSMIFIAGALGLAFQLSRYTVHGPINKETNSYEDSSSRRGLGRTRYASRRSTSRM